VALVQKQMGEHEHALTELRAGRVILVRLKEASPDFARLAHDLAWFETQIAWLEDKAGR
jgi:hypothetical protein